MVSGPVSDLVAERVGQGAPADPVGLESRVDLEELEDRVDLEAPANRVDLEALADRVGPVGLESRVDLEAPANRVDLEALADRVGPVGLESRVDLEELESLAARSPPRAQAAALARGRPLVPAEAGTASVVEMYQRVLATVLSAGPRAG